MTVTTRPAAIPLPEASAFPPALLAAPHWVAYALEERDGQLTKIPKDPHTGRNASSTAPATWADFHAARSYARVRGLGVGLILAPPLIGIDLDDCRDPATGQLTPIATSVLGELDTYAEVSVSGTGVKAIGYGAKPGTRCRKKGLKIEIYDHARLFALTGQRLADAPLAVGDVHEAIAFLYGAAFGKERPDPAPRGPVTPTDEDDAAIIDWLHEHRPGTFTPLWQGLAGDDHSGGDLALCNLLAWRTGDPHRVDRLFRNSGLFRAKWDERRGERTYGEKTVAKAFDGRASFYEPPATSRSRPVILTGQGSSPAVADLVAELRELPHEQLADVVAAQAAELAALRAALDAERRRADQATEMLANVMQIRRNPHIRVERDSLVAVAIEYGVAEKDEEGWATTPLTTLADAVGKSTKAVSEHIARAQDWGLLERKIVNERHTDPETGAVTLRSATRVRLAATPAATLRNLVTIAPAPATKTGASYGGKRDQCPACGKTNTHRETRIVCDDCGHISAPIEAPAPGPVIMTGQENGPATWAAIMGAEVPASTADVGAALTGQNDRPHVAYVSMAEETSDQGPQRTLTGIGVRSDPRSG